MASAWWNFKNISSRPLFTIIFRPEMLKIHPYSILTGEIMVGFVIYCVLCKHLFNLCMQDDAHVFVLIWILVTGHSFLEAFLHLFIQNMTTDFSLNYEFSTCKIEAQYMLCTKIALCQNKKQFDVHNMYWACSFLILKIQWTIYCLILV